eukprot:IDg13024t1
MQLSKNSGVPQLSDLHKAHFNELVNLLGLQDAPPAAPPPREPLCPDFIKFTNLLERIKAEPDGASEATVTAALATQPAVPTATVATVVPVSPTLTPSTCTNSIMDQTVVSYFCKYALKHLKQIASDLPNYLEARQHLKMNMKRLWAEWIGNLITKPMLLQAVRRSFRESFPVAANVDVVQEFRTWYQQQCRLRRSRKQAQHSDFHHATHVRCRYTLVGYRAQLHGRAPLPCCQHFAPSLRLPTLSNTPQPAAPQTRSHAPRRYPTHEEHCARCHDYRYPPLPRPVADCPDT